MPFDAQAVDVDAPSHARSATAPTCSRPRTASQRDDISISYFRNQALPDVNARGQLPASVGVGGTLLSRSTVASVGGDRPPRDRPVASAASARCSATCSRNAFPTWTFGVQYRLSARHEHIRGQPGAGAAAVLAGGDAAAQPRAADRDRRCATPRARCRRTRSASTAPRAARELAERRLEAEEKKFAAGIQTSFFVFQAQRDLAQARTNEIRAIADYNKSLVDFEAVQEGLGGRHGGIRARACR